MNTVIDKCIILSSVSLMCVLFAVLSYEPEPTVYTGVSARDLYVELPRTSKPVLKEITKLDEEYQPVKITYKEMELTYLGRYFITSYCPAECGGSWATASGETCHRADYEYRLSEPTTVAIDRSIHSFGDEFYIEEFDRTFVAEDTGSGVKGHWIDIFYEEYEDVVYFPTGYYDVYSVEWVEVTVIATEEDLKHLSEQGALEYYSQ